MTSSDPSWLALKKRDHLMTDGHVKVCGVSECVGLSRRASLSTKSRLTDKDKVVLARNDRGQQGCRLNGDLREDPINTPDASGLPRRCDQAFRSNLTSKISSEYK